MISRGMFTTSDEHNVTLRNKNSLKVTGNSRNVE